MTDQKKYKWLEYFRLIVNVVGLILILGLALTQFDIVDVIGLIETKLNSESVELTTRIALMPLYFTTAVATIWMSKIRKRIEADEPQEGYCNG